MMEMRYVWIAASLMLLAITEKDTLIVELCSTLKTKSRFLLSLQISFSMKTIYFLWYMLHLWNDIIKQPFFAIPSPTRLLFLCRREFIKSHETKRHFKQKMWLPVLSSLALFATYLQCIARVRTTRWKVMV